ncbi:Ig-like domain repeat protein [Streptomyces sp. NPDC051578]|uniref:Ig-like domain-containing protein n=1 Tax=Streptomyces sp. NPDC051578 TaxID=3365662 RepID=UPI0037B8D041
MPPPSPRYRPTRTVPPDSSRAAASTRPSAPAPRPTATRSTARRFRRREPRQPVRRGRRRRQQLRGPVRDRCRPPLRSAPRDGKAVVPFRYGTATTLIADTGTPLFGYPVTLTATVTPANPAGGPTGSGTFSDGAKGLATVPLAGGRASFTTSGLQPGAHALTASYAGDAADEASTTADPAGITVGFSGPCVTTARSGPLTVAAGQAVCLSSGARQDGPVTVRPGGALAVLDAEVTGPVSGDGALALTVCRSTLAGPLSVRGSTGPVLLGSDEDGPADAGTCAGNRFTGAVSVDANIGGVVIVGNRVTGPLRCEGNEPPPRQTQNTVMEPRSGQCR